MLAHIAGEKWRSKVFAEDKRTSTAPAPARCLTSPWKSTASMDISDRMGKIAEIALGYGGSVGALKSMGALDNGL